MSDSEGSIPSRGSGKSVTFDEDAETMPIRQNQDGQNKEELEKLLQSMIASHSVSEEEQEEESNANKVVGRSESAAWLHKLHSRTGFKVFVQM